MSGGVLTGYIHDLYRLTEWANLESIRLGYRPEDVDGSRVLHR